MAVPTATVALSTASVYPEPAEVGFALAADLGYDAVEVMVALDDDQPGHRCGPRAERGAPAAGRGRARAVPAHHPAGLGHRPVGQARAQRGDVHAARRRRGGRASAVPLAARLRPRLPRGHRRPGGPHRASRSRSRTCIPGAPATARCRPTRRAGTRPSTTRRTSRSTSPTPRPPGRTRWRWPVDLGDRLTHVHMTDGSGSAKDEHLVPGRGTQPCAELLELLAVRGFARPRGGRDQHPARPTTATPARPTWPRRWPSPGCTWRRGASRASWSAGTVWPSAPADVVQSAATVADRPPSDGRPRC